MKTKPKTKPKKSNQKKIEELTKELESIKNQAAAEEKGQPFSSLNLIRLLELMLEDLKKE